MSRTPAMQNNWRVSSLVLQSLNAVNYINKCLWIQTLSIGIPLMNLKLSYLLNLI